jgi:hypothetical protein
MNTAFVLLIVSIAAMVVWNMGRARRALGEIRGLNAQHDQTEAIARELGRRREQISRMRDNYTQALAAGAQLGEPQVGAALWRSADEHIADSGRCVMRMDFLGALAQMNRAISIVGDYK